MLQVWYAHTFNTKTSLAHHFRLVIDFSFLFLDSTSFINCVCEREESDQLALSDLSLHFTHAIRHIFCDAYQLQLQFKFGASMESLVYRKRCKYVANWSIISSFHCGFMFRICTCISIYEVNIAADKKIVLWENVYSGDRSVRLTYCSWQYRYIISGSHTLIFRFILH